MVYSVIVQIVWIVAVLLLTLFLRTPTGIRPIIVTTGSHQKTCVFGTISLDGTQLFRQYKTFDQYSFISYLGELKRKFHKLILFLDRAPSLKPIIFGSIITTVGFFGLLVFHSTEFSISTNLAILATGFSLTIVGVMNALV